ncbi:MAG TPA: peptidase M14, partial [Candidatus Krumholzibacteria bacterium]|nr:peptidase M14 [Candidatus Krumholzibacteria bacterium]
RAARAAAEAAVLPLRFELSYRDSVMMDFDGYEVDATQSDVSGGTWYRYGKKPVTLRVPLFSTQNVTASTTLPQQYWIPPQWTDIIERLQAHGIEFTRLEEPVTRSVKSYRLTKASWARDPFEGHHNVAFSTEPIEETRTFPAGTVVIDTAQRRAKIVAGLLEPEAPDALVTWGFFDPIFEAKEYVESYVMEGIARDMLRESDVLKREFAAAKRDSSLANDPEKIRQWFYDRSRFAETRVGAYPVGRIDAQRRMTSP